MKEIQESAQEYRLEESEAAMDDSVSVPDSNDPESSTAGTMVEEGYRAIDSDSDVDSNEPHQEGFDQVDVSRSGESSTEDDVIDVIYESSLMNEG